MHDIPFQQSVYHASANFAHRRMTHRSLGVGGYGFGGLRACPPEADETRVAPREVIKIRYEIIVMCQAQHIRIPFFLDPLRKVT